MLRSLYAHELTNTFRWRVLPLPPPVPFNAAFKTTGNIWLPSVQTTGTSKTTTSNWDKYFERSSNSELQLDNSSLFLELWLSKLNITDVMIWPRIFPTSQLFWTRHNSVAYTFSSEIVTLWTAVSYSPPKVFGKIVATPPFFKMWESPLRQDLSTTAAIFLAFPPTENISREYQCCQTDRYSITTDVPQEIKL